MRGLSSSNTIIAFHNILNQYVRYCKQIKCGNSLVRWIIYWQAHLAASLGLRDHIDQTLFELHWLPVIYGLKYKLYYVMQATIMSEKLNALITSVTYFDAKCFVPGLKKSLLDRLTCMRCVMLQNFG